MLQWDQLWLLREQQLQLWVLMQWELQWEWKVWAKVTWVKPWVALCRTVCQEPWVEQWPEQWLVAQLDQVTWAQWVTWVALWEDLMADLWVTWAQWEEIWVVPWEILVALLKVLWVPQEDQEIQDVEQVVGCLVAELRRHRRRLRGILRRRLQQRTGRAQAMASTRSSRR